MAKRLMQIASAEGLQVNEVIVYFALLPIFYLSIGLYLMLYLCLGLKVSMNIGILKMLAGILFIVTLMLLWPS